MTDANEITHALRLWFQAGEVFEVRVLDAVSADYRREHIESGYFDYEHISAVPEALKRLLSFRGVYVTVNPVNPDLLARAVNRLRPAGRNPTTADTDIVRRRWLLIDCDPRRASGVSSSNSEHESALAKAREIRDGLSSLGWADLIMTDSGNGAQLMYRIDLSADSLPFVLSDRSVHPASLRGTDIGRVYIRFRVNRQISETQDRLAGSFFLTFESVINRLFANH